MKHLLVLVASLGLALSGARGQSNPVAQPLPFSLVSQTGGTLPAGVAAHKFAAIPTARTTAPGALDLPYITASNGGGWRDEGASGIGLLASGGQPAGAVVVAIDTTARTGIQVSWRAGTILNQASRDCSVALQYRVGAAGAFTDVGSGTTYTSQGKSAGDFSAVLSETLPAAAENQPVVQVRWVYWESNGSTGSRDRIAIDDIAITGTASPSVTQVRVETAPGGGGIVVPAQNVAPNTTVTAYSVARDAGANFVANAAATWSLQSITGGVMGGDLVPAPDGRSATFTAQSAGSARIRATIGGLVSVDSGVVTVPNTPTNPFVVGDSSVEVVAGGQTVLLTADVFGGLNPASTGFAVAGNLSALGGAPSVAFRDDGLGGDLVAGDLTFSLQVTIPASPTAGSKVIPLLVTDAQTRSGPGQIVLRVPGPFTLFHFNDSHSRLQSHDYDVPEVADSPAFEQVGGAPYFVSKILQLKTGKPGSLIVDAGDVSEGGPLGDLRGNGGLIDVYNELDRKLKLLGGRGIDAAVVGNHDVRFPEMLTNMRDIATFPVISMNVIDLATGQPYFPEHAIVTVEGVKVGILGYTTDTSSYLGPGTETMIRVAKCGWDDPGAEIKIRDKVAALRAAPNNCDVVVLLVHVGHSRVFSDDQSDDEYQLVKDAGGVKPPEVVIGGHWHTITDTVWQPAQTNYKTIIAEAASYMQYVGEIGLDADGGYLNAQKHLIDNAVITPDADVQVVLDNLIAEYNAQIPAPAYGINQVIGYSAVDLRLNKNKWWTHNEYPWAGDNTAGAWIADSMQWWVDSQPAYACDLALQSGGGVRRDNAAGPITYREIYETYPWRDDNMILIEVKGQEIWNFIQNDFVGTSISQGWKVFAEDGRITRIERNGVPINPAATYNIVVSDYMYTHDNDKVPGGWSDLTPTVIPYSIRQTVIDYTGQFTQANPMQVPGPRYVLDTTLSGRFTAVVTMVDDVESQPYFESVFVRLLSATPDTVARRGSYVPADLVNPDGSINRSHQFAESMLYRSYLGFKDGLLQPGDKLFIQVEGGFNAGTPQLVEQEGIVSDGVEFTQLGQDAAAAQPEYKGNIASFWDEWHENHFVKFQGEKVAANRIKDRLGVEISVYEPGGYNLKTLPGAVGDQLELTGVQTYRTSERRFRAATAVVVHAAGSVDFDPYSSVDTIAPAVVQGLGASIVLSATASDATEQTFSKLLATDDTAIAQGQPTTNYNLFGASESNRMFLQSAAPAASSFGDQWILTQFNLGALPASATITSATLRLFCFQQIATGAITAQARAMTSDAWDETTATWNTTSGLLGATLDSTLLYTTGDQWYEWDVTAFAQSQDAGAGGDDVASLIVKPAVDDANPAENFTFDTKAYSGGAFGPFLEVEYSGVAVGGGSVTQLAFLYRYAADGLTWGAWTPVGVDSDGAPWQRVFNFPQGFGYYEFHSVATDNTGNVEDTPVYSDASVRFEPTPAVVTLSGLAQTYTGAPRVATATTVPPGLSVQITYNGSPSAPVNAGSYAVVATVTQPGYAGSASGTLVVAQAAQTITFPAPPVKTVGDPAFNLTATATSGLAVAYSSNNPAVATVSGATVTIVGAGTATFTASQPGNGNFFAATPVNQVLTVNPSGVGGGPRVPLLPPWALALFVALLGGTAWRALARRGADRG